MPQTTHAPGLQAPRFGAPRARLDPRLLWQAPVFYLVFGGFGLSCILWSMFAGLLVRLSPEGRHADLGRRGISTGFRWSLVVMRATGLFRCDLSPLDAIADEPRLVVVANHPSLMDAMLLLSRLPRAVCIMKAAVLDNPFLGGGARLAGYIRNDHPPLPLIRRAAHALRQGQQLLVFPEGTRTTTPPLGPLRPGVSLMARAGGAQIQTVLIQTQSPFLAKGWTAWRLPPFPIEFSLRLGRRFPAEVQTETLAAYLRAELEPG